MNIYFTDYAEYLSRFFGTMKVQKISVNSGGTCPNRDGRIGRGGCIYCNNRSFTPGYCMEGKDISSQIAEGKAFFGRKYSEMKYLAYFQSYTSTYTTDIEGLRRQWEDALAQEDVVGLIVGTRPDCIPDEIAKVLAELNRRWPIFVELGVETLCDETLRKINRGHDAACSLEAIERLAAMGLHVGVHLIAGLPGEDDEQVLDNIDKICRQSIESIKLHHLQVLKGTTLHRMWMDGEIEVKPYAPERYLDLCVEVVKRVPQRIAIERFLASSPPEMVEAPRWGLKNYEFTNLLVNRLKKEFGAPEKCIKHKIE
ncbi:MAG: TIGR01212 family radical SAM protein [Lepagella sp.]